MLMAVVICSLAVNAQDAIANGDTPTATSTVTVLENYGTDVKSISRFARNTLDTISYIRKLKSAGVEVYFEKENIWTFDSKSEMVLSMLAAIAQEESRSISENVKIGIRWRYNQGKVSMPYKKFIGYDKVDGRIVVVEEQAEVIRMIYKMFLRDGMSRSAIADKLNDDNVLLCVPRSSLGFKYKLKLDNTVGVIDSDYYYSDNEGHIWVSMTNMSSDKVLNVKKGEAMFQGLILTFVTFRKICAFDF